MATETENLDRRESHLRSITVTAVASLAGIAAGLVSHAVSSGTTPAAQATDTIAIGAYAAFAIAQLGVMRALGIEVSDFSTKDNLYVFFMTFALWYITWGILLTEAV